MEGEPGVVSGAPGPDRPRKCPPVLRILALVLSLFVPALVVPLPLVSAQEIRTLNVNTATAEELDSLPGIGPARAAAIVAARQRRPFRRLTDLLRVPGIGRSTLERLRPYVTFELPQSP